MAATTKQTGDHEPSHPPSAQVEEVAAFLRRYGPPIATGLVLGVCVYFGVMVFRSYRAEVAERASIALMQAENAQAYETIVEQYSDTPAAPVALLGVGSAHFADGRWDEARAAYADFVARYPDHPMHPAAALCLAQCREAGGQVEEALEDFTRFAATHSSSYLGPYAQLGQGRCLEQLGRWEEARTVYEDLVAELPDSVWARQADGALGRVRRTLHRGG